MIRDADHWDVEIDRVVEDLQIAKLYLIGSENEEGKKTPYGITAVGKDWQKILENLLLSLEAKVRYLMGSVIKGSQ